MWHLDMIHFLSRKTGGLAVASIMLLVMGTTVLFSLNQGRGGRQRGHEGALAGIRRETHHHPTDVSAEQVDDISVTGRDAADTESADTDSNGLPRRVVLCRSSLSPPAVARDANAGGLTFRPKIMFIAGIEGSGHHGMVPLIRDIGGVVYIERTDQILTNMWDPTVPIAERVCSMFGVSFNASWIGLFAQTVCTLMNRLHV